MKINYRIISVTLAGMIAALLNLPLSSANEHTGYGENVRAENIGSENQCVDAFNHRLRELHSSRDLDICRLTQDRPLLIVNTASHCGFTPQFTALESLHQQYKDRGLVVLGFASNDFLQAAKTEEQAADICYVRHGVTFNMFSKTSVRGASANPVFKWLAEQSKKPTWNFNKYLVSADRQSVVRFGSRTQPNDPKFIEAIEQLL